MDPHSTYSIQDANSTAGSMLCWTISRIHFTSLEQAGVPVIYFSVFQNYSECNRPSYKH